MRGNTLKQKLEAGQAAFGVMITFPSAPMVEMLGHLGFDWVLIDNEHGNITVDNSEDLIRAAELSNIAPMSRRFTPFMTWARFSTRLCIRDRLTEA